MTAPRDLQTATTAPAVHRGACLDNDQLVAMLSGDVGDDRLDELLAHIDTCPTCAEVMATLGQLDGSARELGRYQLGRVLGSGAMGIVYDAWDPQLRRRVAVKVVRPERADEESRERMLREARALARVSHPNVVTVYDVSEHGGTLCVATELVDGETLGTWQTGKSIPEIVDAWTQAARGLAAAHAGGVVHRDVKPANVLVGRDGRVRVGDFGIARVGNEPPELASGERRVQLATPSGDEGRVTETGYVAGTPAYMAPEQARGEIDARSDQFALCVALAEALSGSRPEAGATNIVPNLPQLDAALARGLQEEPAARFPSMDALADALDAAVAPPPARHRLGAIALAAGAVAVIGTGIAWAAWPHAQTCDVPVVPFDLWSPARRTELAKHVPASVLPRIDGWLAAWSDARGNVCAVERDDAALRARRERCEIDQLSQLDEQLASWTAQDRVVALIAHQDFENLPRTGRCSHEAQLHVPDPTAAQWVRIAAVRLGVRRATDEDCHCAVPRLTELFGDARAIGYPPLAVEVARKLARYLINDDAVAAQRVLRDAMVIADAAGAELPGIEARIEFLELSIDHPPDDLDEISEKTRTLIAQIGGNPELEARLEFALNTIEGSRGHHAEELATAQRGRRAAQLAWGPDSGHEVLALIQIFAAEHDPKARAAARDLALVINRRAKLGMPIEAAATLDTDLDGFARTMDEMIEVARHQYGDSKELAAVYLNAAKAYFIAGHAKESLPYFSTALDLSTAHHVHDKNLLYAYIMYSRALHDLDRGGDAVPIAQRAVELANELGDEEGIGQALVERAKPKLKSDRRGARTDLEQAALALERGQASTSTRAHAEFLLAIAIYPDDHKTARGHATSARNDMQRLVDSIADNPTEARMRVNKQAELDEIKAWLDSHR